MRSRPAGEKKEKNYAAVGFLGGRAAITSEKGGEYNAQSIEKVAQNVPIGRGNPVAPHRCPDLKMIEERLRGKKKEKKKVGKSRPSQKLGERVLPPRNKDHPTSSLTKKETPFPQQEERGRLHSTTTGTGKGVSSLVGKKGGGGGGDPWHHLNSL